MKRYCIVTESDRHELSILRMERAVHEATIKVLRRDHPEAAEALGVAWYTMMDEADAAQYEASKDLAG